MPRNVYFSQPVRSEQNLYEDLIIESLKIYGQDIYYLPRDIVNKDSILGEDQSSKFDDAYMIEGYIEGTDGFEGQGDLYSKFGLEIRDEVNFVISRKIWDRYVGFQDETTEQPRPKEGDLIFLPLTNKFFEVMFVEHEQPFYQLSNLPVYRLQCALYEYAEEEFDTGIAGRIQVSQIGVSGIAEARDFIASSTLTLKGDTSTNTVTITKVYDIGDNSAFVDPTDTQAENVAFEVAADGFLDFTESNPFGDPSDNY